MVIYTFAGKVSQPARRKGKQLRTYCGYSLDFDCYHASIFRDHGTQGAKKTESTSIQNNSYNIINHLRSRRSKPSFKSNHFNSGNCARGNIRSLCGGGGVRGCRRSLSDRPQGGTEPEPGGPGGRPGGGGGTDGGSGAAGGGRGGGGEALQAVVVALKPPAVLLLLVLLLLLLLKRQEATLEDPPPEHLLLLLPLRRRGRGGRRGEERGGRRGGGPPRGPRAQI